ncbi:MAG: hypothetical protein L0H79_06305 [Intrasporangium sp.]|uniref:hypothetical protein n=1 Tax=Intrasporangium sp. TaxID=1925024 RepID=UPI00264A236E|nr:hypothetical protein [Intrasporangium sp.]MDN5795349.1 hypothetical protein [Intrasporangium sp.]
MVRFGTELEGLVTQGAISGFAVGAAQAVTLLPRSGPIALLWPVWLAGVWAVGWSVTTAIGVEVGDRFTVFGSAGAVAAALLTCALPVLLVHRTPKESRS